ncbi:MAG TPA: hypothetical protein VF222_05330 [Nitrososphaeraceae archaeon]
MNNKLSKSSPTMLIIILAGIAIVSASSYSIDEAMAFPHASLIIDPKEEEHANDIRVVLGHTNEPAYGKLPGIHDGKHNLEVDLSDDATTLPIPNATLFADKYYFKNIASFQRAESLEDADAIELNVPISAVFGQPGTFYNRQVIDAGIYGYTIRGTINYYDVAQVPLENATKFCSIPGEDLTKFDTDGWNGSYGCPQNIKSIFFPPASKYPDNNYNNYPPPQYDQYDDGYGNYQQQQQQYDNNNNDYGYVKEDYKQYDNNNNNNNNYDDKRDNGRDDKKNDKKDDSKEYDKNYDNNDNNYDYQYRYEYTDDNGEYGNEYASYGEE